MDQLKQYMVWTKGGRRFITRAPRGTSVIRLVNQRLDDGDYAVNAFNWDDEMMVRVG